jgi:hypothetical protein
MKRIESNDVTTSLVNALEEAGEFEFVAILYQKRPEYDNGNSGFFLTKGVTYMQLVFHLE